MHVMLRFVFAHMHLAGEDLQVVTCLGVALCVADGGGGGAEGTCPPAQYGRKASSRRLSRSCLLACSHTTFRSVLSLSCVCRPHSASMYAACCPVLPTAWPTEACVVVWWVSMPPSI